MKPGLTGTSKITQKSLTTRTGVKDPMVTTVREELCPRWKVGECRQGSEKVEQWACGSVRTRRTIRVTEEDYELEPGKARVKERSQTPSKKDERASE